MSPTEANRLALGLLDATEEWKEEKVNVNKAEAELRAAREASDKNAADSERERDAWRKDPTRLRAEVEPMRSRNPLTPGERLVYERKKSEVERQQGNRTRKQNQLDSQVRLKTDKLEDARRAEERAFGRIRALAETPAGGGAEFLDTDGATPRELLDRAQGLLDAEVFLSVDRLGGVIINRETGLVVVLQTRLVAERTSQGRTQYRVEESPLLDRDGKPLTQYGNAAHHEVMQSVEYVPGRGITPDGGYTLVARRSAGVDVLGWWLWAGKEDPGWIRSMSGGIFDPHPAVAAQVAPFWISERDENAEGKSSVVRKRGAK